MGGAIESIDPGMSAWEHSRNRTLAIQAEAGASCERNVWSGLFSVFALANVLGRPIFSVYPNVQPNSIRDFFHGIISPFVPGNVEQVPVYIMWSRLSDTCFKSESWYSPNHFIPLIPLKQSRDGMKSNEEVQEHRSVKRKITSFFTKITDHPVTSSVSDVDHQVNKKVRTIKQDKDDLVTTTKPNCKSSNVNTPPPVPKQGKTTSNTVTRKLTRLTVEKWKHNDLAQYEAGTWLDYDTSKTSTGSGKYCTALKCKLCTQFQSSIEKRKHFSRAFIDGSTNFRLTNVIDHANSDMHKIAISLFHAENGQKAQSFKNQPTLDFKLNPTQVEDLKRKFDISYFIVKEELPLAKYEKILNLERRHGVPHSAVYSNRTAATEFISYQAKELQTELSKDIAKANFYSIMFDGTTDKSVTEQEAVYALYFDPDPVEPELSDKGAPMVKVKMGFISLENVKSSDAQGVLDGIKNSLDTLGLKKLPGTPPTPLGLGGDGCSTNRGETGGVQALFRKEFPWSIFVWCMAHRLELALKDALSSSYFKEVDEALLRMYYLYEKSPKKMRGLFEIYKAYKETFDFAQGSLKPKRASGTRWIAHKLDALKLLVDKFGIIMQHLETLSCDKSVKSADQAKLRGYLKKWKTGKLLLFSCFFIDLLQPAAFLSYAFQENNVDAVSVTLALSKTKKSLNTLRTKEPENLPTVKFYFQKVQEEEYQGTKLPGFESAVGDLKQNAARYVSLVENAIERRLVGTDDISTVASLLNCEVWECASRESMNETILLFLAKFKDPLIQQGLQVSDLEVVQEWNDMVDFASMYLSLSCQHYRSTWYKIFHVSRASNWKNILLLIRLLFTFPVSNAAVERFFSCLGRVKTSQRSTLSQATLQHTLRILVSGKALDSYDPHAAICAWEEAKNRRPNQRQRKKYKERRKERHFGIKDVSTSETSDDSDNELQYGENSAEERISALGSVELFSSTSGSDEDEL